MIPKGFALLTLMQLSLKPLAMSILERYTGPHRGSALCLDLQEQLAQRVSELHRILVGEVNSGFVHATEGQVTDGSGTVLWLRDDPRGAVRTPQRFFTTDSGMTGGP